jgi:hypothetical protein
MPIARFEMPDGRIARFDVPDGTTPEQAKTIMENYFAPPKREVGAMDRAGAAVAGINKGFFSDLLGLPVDAAANALDLGKAAVGYTTSKVTGKAPPEWTEPFDRRAVPGSADWIAARINQGADAIGVRSPIDNPDPQDQASRILYTGGRVGGASIVPNPNAQIGPVNQLRNFLMAEAGGLTAGAVGEASPEWAGVAGMVPQVIGAGSIAATKRAVRGDETGRREMEQRIQDFKNAGVENPSVGLASGNRTVQGVENILSQTPGSVRLYESHKNALLDAMQARTSQLRNRTSTVYGPEETGAAIQSDLKGAFKERIGNTYSTLNDRVEAAVGPNTKVPVTESLSKARSLVAPIPGAEETSALLTQARIKNIQEALQADAGAKPAQTVYVGGQTVQVPAGHHGTKSVQQPGLLDVNGVPMTTTIPATPPAGLPFSALKELRTKIGKEAQSNAIMGTPEQAEFKQLYGAMSQDMKNGVALADLGNGRMPADAGSATTALNRANSYYSKAMTRADDLNPIANRNTPEGAYSAVSQSLNSGPTVYQRLRNAVTPETRQKIVASVIDDMGKATPGQQSADGDAWSPRTFLTNYNKIDDQARTELFKRIPGGTKLAADLKDVAKAAEMVSESSKVWANPSGTTPAMTSRATLGALTVGAFFEPLTAASVAGGLLAANQASQRLLLNPTFVGWLAKTPKVSPQGMQSYIQTLIANAEKTNDPQFKQDVGAYIASVQDGINQK